MPELERMNEPERQSQQGQAQRDMARASQMTGRITGAGARVKQSPDQLRAMLSARLLEQRGLMMATLTHELADMAVPVVEDIRESVLNRSAITSFEQLRALDIYSADIEHHCSQLQRQVEQDRFNGRLQALVLSDGQIVPISNADAERATESGLDRAFRAGLVSTKDAVDGFAAGLKSFVLRRMVGQFFFPRVDALMGGTVGGGNGVRLPVEVHSTQTVGARVEYSPAYFIAYTVLAAPTSPAIGAVPPGRYIFKLTKAGSERFDRGLFDIPDQFRVDLQI